MMYRRSLIKSLAVIPFIGVANFVKADNINRFYIGAKWKPQKVKSFTMNYPQWYSLNNQWYFYQTSNGNSIGINFERFTPERLSAKLAELEQKPNFTNGILFVNQDGLMNALAFYDER